MKIKTWQRRKSSNEIRKYHKKKIAKNLNLSYKLINHTTCEISSIKKGVFTYPKLTEWARTSEYTNCITGEG